MTSHDGFRIFWATMLLRTSILILVLASTTLLTRVIAQDGAVQPRALSPAEFLTSPSFDEDGRIALPGQVRTRSSAEQDSAYRRALALAISASQRFAASLAESSSFLRMQSELQRRPSIWEQINTMMNIPAEILQPSPQERTQYQLTIANAMYVPGVLLYPMGTGNAMVNFSDIAKVFGFGEDVGPEIRYVVDETIEVEIVVYSTQALIVASPFRGIQAPGAYTITWDGKDQRGKKVTDGEYIAEVRLGGERIMRKRISIRGR